MPLDRATPKEKTFFCPWLSKHVLYLFLAPLGGSLWMPMDKPAPKVTLLNGEEKCAGISLCQKYVQMCPNVNSP
jgi:hypothetical protein